MAVIFADAVGFSKLAEPQVPQFVQHFLGQVASLADRYGPEVRNTWGDGLYFLFAQVGQAGRFALELRDVVAATDWSAWGLPADLTLRIALHAGPVFRCDDPVTGQRNYTGRHVSRAARLEPVTPPGEVYTTQAFAAVAAAVGIRDFIGDYVGSTGLAKGYGAFPTYHLRRRSG